MLGGVTSQFSVSAPPWDGADLQPHSHCWGLPHVGGGTHIHGVTQPLLWCCKVSSHHRLRGSGGIPWEGGIPKGWIDVPCPPALAGAVRRGCPCRRCLDGWMAAARPGLILWTSGIYYGCRRCQAEKSIPPGRQLKRWPGDGGAVCPLPCVAAPRGCAPPCAALPPVLWGRGLIGDSAHAHLSRALTNRHLNQTISWAAPLTSLMY